MVTPLDTPLRQAALDLIDTFGKAVTLTVLTGSAFAPATGDTSGGTTTPVAGKISPPEPFNDKYIDGEVVQRGDARCFLAAQGLTITPVVDMTITIDTKVWRVVSINTIYSGDLIAAFDLQIRR